CGPPNASIESFKQVALITGIATPDIFLARARESFSVIKHFKFRDHQTFSHRDLMKFKDFASQNQENKIAFLTTEKDAMRLKNIIGENDAGNLCIFYWEIGIEWIEGKSEFDKLILNYINGQH
ncbi:MAG TPA: tetraacyldisaccharide 4'-kinase, partial [Cryomorphaceae bacterium]|nr:tetraacyldisaccharide 4'-kinase [Cryomorphaceae bacterium]